MPRKRFRFRAAHLQSLSRGPGSPVRRLCTSLNLSSVALICVFRGLLLVLASITCFLALMKHMSCRQCRRQALTSPTMVLIARLMFVVLTKPLRQLQIPQPTKKARSLRPVTLMLMPTLQGGVTLWMWKH